jgi:hypothetical protein
VAARGVSHNKVDEFSKRHVWRFSSRPHIICQLCHCFKTPFGFARSTTFIKTLKVTQDIARRCPSFGKFVVDVHAHGELQVCRYLLVILCQSTDKVSLLYTSNVDSTTSFHRTLKVFCISSIHPSLCLDSIPPLYMSLSSSHTRLSLELETSS